ncbi:SCO family protein [Nocardiopsis sp. NPDC055879]
MPLAHRIRSLTANPALHSRRARYSARAAAVLAVGLLVSACGLSESQDEPLAQIVDQDDESHYRGVYLDPPMEVPHAVLTDTSGQAFDLHADTTAPVTLLYFGYTNCPDACPTTMADVAQALDQLDTDQREQVQVVFITTDPERDTGSVLRAWLDNFDSDFVGLSGDIGETADIAEPLGIALEEKTDHGNGHYDVDHGAQVLAFDPDEQGRLLFLTAAPVEDFVHDLPLLLEETEGGAK